MGSGRVLGSTRYSPSQYPPSSHYPGYTPPPSRQYSVASTVRYSGCKVVVGFRSVDQLTLSAKISGFQGITEGYNLLYVGRIINHLSIPGTK